MAGASPDYPAYSGQLVHGDVLPTELLNQVCAAADEVKASQAEYHQQIAQLPGHSLVLRPQEPNNAYILDYRNLERVKTIKLQVKEN